MTLDSVLTLAREALWVAFCVCGPVLAATSLVGLLVAIGQAITQVNEGSLPFTAKLVTSLAVILYLGSWMLTRLVWFVNTTLSGGVR